MTALEINRSDFSDMVAVPTTEAHLKDGEVRLAISPFALTANNISYVVFGDLFGYWNFFPTTSGWGRSPVWAFASVTESRCEGVNAGERFFGYYEMAETCVHRPTRISPSGYVDGTAHRQALPAPYNSYANTANDPHHRPETEALQSLLLPLFTTSFSIDGFLGDQDDFGASAVIITSASSKTAQALAFSLRRRAKKTVGLTSTANVAFTKSLGLYTEVIAYDAIDTDLENTPSVIVDIAGDRQVLGRLSRTLGTDLVYSMAVGGTHWNVDVDVEQPLSGPEPVFFFAPTQIEKRRAELGAKAAAGQVAESWLEFVEWVAPVMTVTHVNGAPAIIDAYRTLLSGSANPSQGLICAL